VGDAADRLAALAQLAHIPYADAVVTTGCGQQMLLTWLNLHYTMQSNTLKHARLLVTTAAVVAKHMNGMCSADCHVELHAYTVAA